MEENVLVCSISQIVGLEGNPQVKLYLYIDDSFAFKTRVYPKNSSPEINLDIDMYAPSLSNSGIALFRVTQ